MFVGAYGKRIKLLIQAVVWFICSLGTLFHYMKQPNTVLKQGRGLPTLAPIYIL